MKGVVVEIKGKYAVALNKQGEFIKIRNNGRLQVGYEIDVPSVTAAGVHSLARIASIAAVFLLVVSVGFGAYSYSAPYAYVNIDINPSIELTTNIYDRIIRTKGINEDGEKLLKAGGLKNKKLQDGIKEILEDAVEEGYLKPDSENAVMLTVSSRDQKKAAQIQKKAESVISEELKITGVESEVVAEKATLQRHEEADKRGISPGKMLLIEKLVEANPDLSDEEVKRYEKGPVKDILKSIKEIGKTEKAGKKEEKEERKEETKDHGVGKGKVEDKGKPESSNGASKPGKNDEGEKKMDESAPGNEGNSDISSNEDNGGLIDGKDDSYGDSGSSHNGNNDGEKGGKDGKDPDSPGNSKDKEDKTTGNSDKEEKAADSKPDNTEKGNAGNNKDSKR